MDFAGLEEQKNTFLYLGKKTEGAYQWRSPRKIPHILHIKQQMEGLG